MLRNLKQKTKSLMLLAAQSVTADINTASADMQMFRSFAFLVSAGTFSFTGVNKIALKIQESDDNSTWADAPLSSYYEGAVTEMNSSSFQNAVTVIQYRGEKRYVRMTLDVSGTVAAPIAVVGLSTDLEIMPS